MSPHSRRSLLAILLVVGSLSCTESPVDPNRAAPRPSADVSSATPTLLISQIYGGGGNSGATFTNDFVELHNAGAQPVTVDGWSVQYSSASGTTWQATPLTGTIQPGAYYLVQESQGAGGTIALPTPDASGSIAMGATAGKIALAQSTTALSGSCPVAGAFVDEVSFGTTATDCGAKTTATLSNTTAALRQDEGCRVSGDLSADFTTGTPAPRNAATPVSICPGVQPPGPLDHVVVAGASTVIVGSKTQLTASPRDASNQLITTAHISWKSSDSTVASVDTAGVVTGVVVSANPVTITATAVDSGITKSGSAQITVNTAGINWIDVSSSATSFPPGFQTQLFATARTASGGTVIPATFTFESLNPELATVTTVANTGIIMAVAAPADGTTRPGFKITATPTGGGASFSFTTKPITIEAPASAPTSIYAKNDEFGDPSAASTSLPNDLLITRPQYTISYNESHGTPNWVSYELDARQMVAGQDRCNCFTSDPLLPVAKQIFTSDYTNGGYDRGHMTRSADRTAGNVDNATTFYLTNVVPQMADLNQGVWAQFENALADSATLGGRAVYIITGPLYSRSHGLTFLKGESKVAIPDSTWKIAFIGPRTGGTPFSRATIQSWGDLAGTTVLAVSMPNVAGVRNDPWMKYLTTVDRIETATGYDFLSLLPTAFQAAIEDGDHSPTARFVESGPVTGNSAISFDASTSTDPDLGRTDLDRTESLTYAWTFGDGASASGKLVSHSFTHDGTFVVTLKVTDAFGWESVTAQTFTIADVPPSISSLTGATLLQGERYATSGSFTDPDLNSWTATVDYGDGSGTQALALAGKSFQLGHTYASAGSFTLTVSVNDGEIASSAHAGVLVETPLQGIGHLSTDLDAIAASLNSAAVGSLRAELQVADSELRKAHPVAAQASLAAFVTELTVLTRTGRLSTAQSAPIIAYAQRVIVSIGSSSGGHGSAVT
jgi:DNA/RNA endonuclease G (NUC1)